MTSFDWRAVGREPPGDFSRSGEITRGLTPHGSPDATRSLSRADQFPVTSLMRIPVNSPVVRK
jgi:hypothetical protein